MKGFRYLKDVTTLQVDEAKCTGCRRCVEVCPHQVFAIKDRKVAVIDRDACMECGACATNCATAAITVDAGVGCASGLMTEWLRERKLGSSGSGGCC